MNTNNKSWKIFIATHERVYDEMYSADKTFNKENYVILNVNTSANKEILNAENYSVISQRDFKSFKELGRNWAESEAIWNLWKEGIHKELDYIGFTHYDVALTENTTSEIQAYINEKEKAHIAFLEFDSKTEWKKWNSLKNVQPLKTGEKKGYYQYILDDYNTYFKTNYTAKDFTEKKLINLCSNFLLDSKTFDKMMGFFDWVIKEGRIGAFDNSNDPRLMGGLAERYFGVFLQFEYAETKSLPLYHVGVTTSSSDIRKRLAQARQADSKKKLGQQIIDIIRLKAFRKGLCCFGLTKRLAFIFAGLLHYDDEKFLYRTRNFIYRLTGMKLGKKVFISRGLDIWGGWNIKIDDNVCLGQNNTIQAFSPVRIRSYVHTARELLIVAGSHDVSDFGAPATNQSVDIGAGTWIGTRVTILGGVKIGKGCVIGANSLVNKDIPDFSIAVGVPCKVIKKREPAKIITSPAGDYTLDELLELEDNDD